MAIVGMGTDIVEIARIAKVSETFGDKLAYRILTSEELLRYKSHSDPVRFLAKRFAIKEAASKALGLGMRQGVAFNQFGSLNNELGQPHLVLSGKASEIAKQKGITSSHLSVSDEIHYALAVVIFEN